MKKMLSFVVVFLPWRIKRWLLIKVWKFEISPTAHIGVSYIYPKQLIMKAGSSIDHFSVAIHLDRMVIGERSSIGRSNWITGYPTQGQLKHFTHQLDRISELIMGDHSAITKRHHIDCTNQIRMGNFVTIAGYSSQLLTHAIDLNENRQHSKPIYIGDYCFVGTNTVILGGAKLPDRSVLGAKSLLNKAFDEPWALYVGCPAKFSKKISESAKYFSRIDGFVH